MRGGYRSRNDAGEKDGNKKSADPSADALSYAASFVAVNFGNVFLLWHFGGRSHKGQPNYLKIAGKANERLRECLF